MPSWMSSISTTRTRDPSNADIETPPASADTAAVAPAPMAAASVDPASDDTTGETVIRPTSSRGNFLVDGGSTTVAARAVCGGVRRSRKHDRVPCPRGPRTRRVKRVKPEPPQASRGMHEGPAPACHGTCHSTTARPGPDAMEDER
ncbi:hypothetical protein GCM10010216_08770 [Streptomyces flaveolus]|nr:hypothetical protein GCM10010216_08770 [Streptomyces flaveolus]